MRTVGVIAIAIAAFVPSVARADRPDLSPPSPASSTDLLRVDARVQPNDGDTPHVQPSDMAHPGTLVAPADLARADVLFRVARELRAAGLYSDACPKFAETQRLVPGIGVTLYLADCYEHLGRLAWAWTEFRAAEEVARQHNDSRAGVARSRAAALEPKLKRLTIAVSKSTQKEGLEVALDGAPIPPEKWNVTLATDPGDHALAFRLRGGDLRTMHVRVGTETPSITVPLDQASADQTSADQTSAPSRSPAPASSPAPAPLAAAPTPSVASSPPASASASAASPVSASFWTNGATRSAVELGLLGGAVAAVGAGAGFLAVRDHALAHDETSGAGAVSAVAFALGGAALVSAVVLYLTAPDDKSSALVVSPVPLAAGAAAVVGGRF